MEEVSNSWADKIVGKAISRKLLVWLTATIFAALGLLSGDHWVALSLAYIGIQGVADIATAWKSGKILQNYAPKLPGQQKPQEKPRRRPDP